MSASEIYLSVDELRKVFEELRGKKYLLDCGHRVTFGYHLGADITIINGKHPDVICSLCGH